MMEGEGFSHNGEHKKERVSESLHCSCQWKNEETDTHIDVAVELVLVSS